MRINARLFTVIASVLIFIVFSEAVISYFVVTRIPEEMIIRKPLNSLRSVFNFSLLFKLLPFVILSVILGLYSIRFKYRYLIIACIPGFIGLVIPWVTLLCRLSESWITSLNLSSTSGLSYLVLPVIVLPTALAGLFIGLSGVLLWNYFNRSAPSDCYNIPKSRTTCLTEGSVYLILGAVILTAIYSRVHPYLAEDRASSVMSSEKRLEKYLYRGKEESNIGLLSSLASNPKLPVRLIEEIYKMAPALCDSDYKNLVRIYSSLAENIKSPGYILSSISELNNSLINKVVALNPNTPEKVLIYLSGDLSDAVKISVARNQNTPVEALENLSSDSHYVIRRFVARHKNVTKEMLIQLTNDKDDRVKSVALQEIKKFRESAISGQ